MKKITSPNPVTPVLTAVMPWKGMPNNTAIISRSLVESGTFTTLEIEKIEVILDETEELTDCPKNVSEEKVAKLDQDGIVRLGTTVAYDDVLIGIQKAPEGDLTKNEIMLTAIFGDKAGYRDRSVTMPFKDSGVVIDIEKTEKRVTVYLLIKRELRVGDILCSPEGKEFAVAEILEIEDMPHVEFFTTLTACDAVLVSQTDIQISTERFWGGTFTVMHSVTNPNQVLLRHQPRKKKTIKWSATGITTMPGHVKLQKVELLLEQKADAPRPLNRHMGSRCLIEGYKISDRLINTLGDNGLMENLTELLTIKSDDPYGYQKAIGTILYSDNSINKPDFNANVSGTVHMGKCLLESMGFKVETDNDSLCLQLDPSNSIERLSSREVKDNNPLFMDATLANNELFDPLIFGPATDHKERTTKFGHICLPVPLLHPLRVSEMKKFKAVLESKKFSNSMLKKGKSWSTEIRNVLAELNIKPEYIIEHIMVLPADMRQPFSDINRHYNSVLRKVTLIQTLMDRMSSGTSMIASEIGSLQSRLNSLYGLNKEITKGLLDSLAEVNSGLYEKKVAFSAKSLVVPDNELKTDECSIPVAIGLEIFKPFIQRALMEENEENGPYYAGRLVKSADPEAVKMLYKIAPDLQVIVTNANQSKLSAFNVVIDEKSEIAKLHTTAINQLTISLGVKGKIYIHTPLSQKAREETQQILFSKTGVKESSNKNSIESSLLLKKNTLLEIANGTHDGKFALSQYDKIVLGK